MRKPGFCIYKNKDTDQLVNFKSLDIPGCIAQFVSGLVGNSKVRFSHEAAQIQNVT